MFKVFKSLFQSKSPEQVNSKPPKETEAHPLTPQLQQQLFELGRVTYLYEGNKQLLIRNVKALAAEIEEANRADKKPVDRPSAPTPATPEAAPAPETK